MALLKWLLLSAVVGYLCLAALLYVRQRSLMYFPDSGRVSPAAARVPQADEVELATSDGERVIVWHVPPRGDEPVVLYFRGMAAILPAGRALSEAHLRRCRSPRAELSRLWRIVR